MKFTKFADKDVPRVKKDITADIVSGAPEQHAYLKFSGHGDTIKSGIWESTAGVFTAVMQDQIEFCHILEGGAVIKTDVGTFEVTEGDAFVMESGLKTEWTVETYVKKHFVICAV
jgi:uncharacterized cupin superfamily protein